MIGSKVKNEIARWLAALSLVAAPTLAFGGIATAQTGQQGIEQQGQQHMGQQHMGQQSASATKGMVRGTVQNVDLAQGSVTIRSGNETPVTLRARPSEIASLSPGDDVSLPFSTFGGVKWVAEGQGTQGQQQHQQQQMGQAPNARSGQLTGTVSSIDKNNGTITVEGQTFAAHPQQLKDIAPGQQVTLSYSQFGQMPWLSQIQSAPGGSVAQGGAQQGQQQQLGSSQGKQQG